MGPSNMLFACSISNLFCVNAKLISASDCLWYKFAISIVLLGMTLTSSATEFIGLPLVRCSPYVANRSVFVFSIRDRLTLGKFQRLILTHIKHCKDLYWKSICISLSRWHRGRPAREYVWVCPGPHSVSCAKFLELAQHPLGVLQLIGRHAEL